MTVGIHTVLVLGISPRYYRIDWKRKMIYFWKLNFEQSLFFSTLRNDCLGGYHTSSGALLIGIINDQWSLTTLPNLLLKYEINLCFVFLLLICSFNTVESTCGDQSQQSKKQTNSRTDSALDGHIHGLARGRCIIF